MGSEAEAQKTEASSREQGDEHPLTGAEARAVSGSSLTAGDQAGQPGAKLLLLTTDPRVKAATLIREGILLWTYV